jgi:hypothetical protein
LIRRVLIPALLLLGLTGLGSAVARGGSRIATPMQASPATDLRIVLVDYLFGEETYRLSCSPPSGTAPNPQAICAAITSEPSLVFGQASVPPSCPQASRRTEVKVSGTYMGKTVATVFGPCRSYQSDLGERWYSFFPAAEAVDRVRIDRGVGPLSLGESRSAVQALLGTGRKGPLGLVLYPRIVHTGVKSVYGVGYDSGGVVDTLLSTSTQLTLSQHRIGSISSPQESNALFKAWTRIDCGGIKAWTNRAADHVPTTIVGSGSKQPVVIISRVPRRICSAMRARVFSTT